MERAGNVPLPHQIAVSPLPSPVYTASWKPLWRLRQFVAFHYFKEALYTAVMYLTPCFLLGISITLYRAIIFLPLFYVLRYFIHRYVGYMVLPAQRRSVESLIRLQGAPRVGALVSGFAQMLYSLYANLDQARTRLQGQHRGRSMTIAAVDGTLLDTMLLPARGGAAAGGSTRFVGSGQAVLTGNDRSAASEGEVRAMSRDIGKGLVIVFGGNGELFEMSQWPGPVLAGGFSVLLANFRGIGRSQGHSTKVGLLQDAASVIDFAINGLQVPAHKIILLGHSLGGGLASVVAPLFPGIHFCHERSFASLSEACVAVVHQGTATMAAAVDRSVPYWVPVCLRLVAGWELDAVQGWPLHRGNALITVTSGDKVLPPRCQLPTILAAANTWGGVGSAAPWRIEKKLPSGVAAAGGGATWSGSGHTVGKGGSSGGGGGGLFGLSRPLNELDATVNGQGSSGSGGSGGQRSNEFGSPLRGIGSVASQCRELLRQAMGKWRNTWREEGRGLGRWCCAKRTTSGATTNAAMDRARLASLRANAFANVNDNTSNANGNGNANMNTAGGGSGSGSGTQQSRSIGDMLKLGVEYATAAVVTAVVIGIDCFRGIENGIDTAYLWVATPLSLAQSLRVIRGLPAIEGNDTVEVLSLAPTGDAHNRALYDFEMEALLTWMGKSVEGR